MVEVGWVRFAPVALRVGRAVSPGLPPRVCEAWLYAAPVVRIPMSDAV